MQSISSVDFEEFHSQELPMRLESGNGALAATTMKPGRTFAWKLTNGQAYTYKITPNTLEIEPGYENANVTVEISPEDWSIYAQELKSCFGMLYTDSIKMISGDFNHFSAWEPTLLAAYFGRPIYNGAPPLLDLDRQPLDLHQTFTLQDSLQQASHFLKTAGFLHFKNVFSPQELEVFKADIEKALQKANSEDGRSWWAEKEDGSSVCCRLTYMNEKSAAISALQDDPRLLKIGALAGGGLIPCPERLDGYSVVIKHGNIKTGLSDLPWHRDCGMGGHPLLCPGLNVGIQLDPANKENGQLHFLAGSHHHSNQGLDVEPDWPAIPVNTEPGDVTAHFGHTLHVAPPPQVQNMGRKALYVGFSQPILNDYVPLGQGYNDVLFSHKAGQIRSPEEVQVERAVN